MALPVAPVTYPSALDGETNGKITAAKLRTVPSLHGGNSVTLLIVAIRSFLAMRAAAAKDGIRLEVISSYRTYAKQVALFTERYVPYYAVHTSGRVTYRIWEGKRWYHAYGPTTAVPGTSNHGRGLAIDFIITTSNLNWLLNNAHLFGWSWEIQSENWHLRHTTGDRLTQAVLDYEKSLNPTEPEPSEEDDMPKPMLAYLGTSTRNVCQIDASRSAVHWVQGAAAIRGAKTMAKLDQPGVKNAGAVCRLDPRSADTNVKELALFVLGLPFYGPMPPGHANLLKELGIAPLHYPNAVAP